MNVPALLGVLLVAGILGVSLVVGARLGKLGTTHERRRDTLLTYAVLFVFIAVLAIPLSQGWEPDDLQLLLLTGILGLVLSGILGLVRLYD